MDSTIYRGPISVGMQSVAGWIESASLAVAGLVVAVSMVTGMFQMIDSFGTQFRNGSMCVFRQICMSRGGVTGSGNINGIDPEHWTSFWHPNIKYADVMRVCMKPPKSHDSCRSGYEALGGGTPDLVEKARRIEPSVWSGTGIDSETFARRFDVLSGGVVELETPAGLQKVSPFGIFCDYGNEFGMAAISSDVWVSGPGKSAHKCEFIFG